MDDKKRYLIMAITITVTIVLCVVVFSILPFKELPFIYNEF